MPAPSSASASPGKPRDVLVELARAFGGAILFALPLLMTMEMWELGFYMDRLRLALFMALMVPLLVGLSHYAGFEPTATWADDVADALVAYGVAFVASALVLTLFRVVTPAMPPGEIVGKVALQAVPGSFGAMLARSQLGEDEPEEEAKRQRGGYGMEVFLMTAGAVFLAFNVAPTEEMVLIAYMLTPWHALALALVSLALMHGFVYASGFAGSADHRPEDVPGWSLFLRFTVVGYAVALLVSAYVLWTFGRIEDSTLGTYVVMAVVLSFPASIGAAAARLLL